LNKIYDVCILGAGIMGVTLASKLVKNTNLKVCVVEAGPAPGLVQTNKNSGVVHSGIFYRDTQNILAFCLDGKQRVVDYCLKHDLPIKLTGKSIKTKAENELELINRCENYNLNHTFDGSTIKLPEVCLVDYLAITNHQYENCKDKVDFYFNLKTYKINENTLSLNNGEIIKFNKLVNLTGIHANDIYREISGDDRFTVCEIIGRYHEFNLNYPHMIYSGPDKKLPFLGVHITPTFKKTVKLGPDAFPIVFSKSIGNSIKDLRRRSKFFLKNINYFIKNLFNHSPKSMLNQSKKLEDIGLTMDMYIKNTHGVRSVLLNEKGELEKNFIFKQYKNTYHLLNSHSPAATCCFTIADHLINMIIN
jgi:L-2-hydroxyglutarate oxidase